MSDTSAATPSSRNAVVAVALDLFDRNGFDATSVEQIAQAAGSSRSTFFRQFGGKDDVVFADHEVLLARVREYLSQPHENPWAAVCDAAVTVFEHFAADPDLARRRYSVVRKVPALREREIVTVFRYERLFDEYLRRALPGLDPVEAVGFSAAIAAVHNHVLRQLLRDTAPVPVSVLRHALDDVMRKFGVHPDPAHPEHDEVVVAVFPRRMPLAEVTRRIGSTLEG
ncbi:TetR family transcriptional regulator [Microbacterium sp. bgisy207]|jgi:AcrR family transcriptional regulator|uniref:TetR family transcriptional regulator n=1 Tax=Microbacterium sp. bgisy207 TaxID=3413800 RepID=UPI003EB7328D